jgi:hypothetical protein
MKAASRWLLCLKCALLAGGLLFSGLLLAGEGTIQTPAAGPWVWSGDAAGLHCLSLCELDDLYRRATVHGAPHGWLPGEVIVFTNMPAPKLVKRLADTFWVGKHIEPDGYFINQWKNRQALDSYIRIGPSYVDGCPSIVFEYPRCTPLFGPMRDEYREIAPGLFLGRMYRRVPCVRFLGYNYLQLSPSGCCASNQPPIEGVAPPAPPAGAGGSPAIDQKKVIPAKPNK